MTATTRNDVTIAEIKTDIAYIKADLQEIKIAIKAINDGFVTRAEFIDTRDRALLEHKTFVTKDEFEPFKKGIFAIAIAVFLSVVNSVMEVIKIK